MKYKYTRPELEEMSACPWLTVRERKVFVMFYRKGRRIEDIAAELEVSRRTVDRILAKVRKASKTALK